jgi:small-conductance mechanosensitive channel
MVDSIETTLSDIGDMVFIDHPAIRILLTLLTAFIIQSVSRRITNRIIERTVRTHKHSSRGEEHKREATLKTFFHTTISVTIWIIAILASLWQLHLDLSALLTSAGLIGVIAGIGGQNVIKDCLAGLFIIIENQLRVDDIVTIATPTATISGMVEEVAIRTTRLRDLDGNLHILSNGAIGVITNKSYHFAQVNIDINITYDTDIDLIERLIEEAGAITAHKPRYRHDIMDPITMLRVDQLGDSTVTIKALGKVKPGAQWDVAGDFRRNLKDLFDKHKVKAPYQTFVIEEEPVPPTKK